LSELGNHRVQSIQIEGANMQWQGIKHRDKTRVQMAAKRVRGRKVEDRIGVGGTD
jgi:hypothetical protein